MNEALGSFQACIPYFEALGDSNRQLLILALARNHQAMNVGTLTETVALSRPAVSHHLKVLLQSGLVGFRRQGTENLYYLTAESMVKTLKNFIVAVEESCSTRRGQLANVLFQEEE